MTKRQLDLKLGPILGQITARALTVVQRMEKKVVEYSPSATARGVMCHAQVVAGGEVSKYKIPRFFGRQNV